MIADDYDDDNHSQQPLRSLPKVKTGYKWLENQLKEQKKNVSC